MNAEVSTSTAALSAIHQLFSQGKPDEYRRTLLRWMHRMSYRFQSEIAGGWTVLAANPVRSTIPYLVEDLSELAALGQFDGLEPAALFLLDAAASVKLSPQEEERVEDTIGDLLSAANGDPAERLTDFPFFVPLGRHSTSAISEIRSDVMLLALQNVLGQLSQHLGQGNDIFGFDMNQWMKDSGLKNGACALMSATTQETPGLTGSSGASNSPLSQTAWDQHSSMKNDTTEFCGSDDSESSLGSFLGAFSLTSCLNVGSEPATQALTGTPLMRVSQCVQESLDSGSSCPICGGSGGGWLDWIPTPKSVDDTIKWFGTSESDLARADGQLTRSELNNMTAVELHQTNKQVHKDMMDNEAAIEREKAIIDDPDASEADKDVARAKLEKLAKERVKLEKQDRRLEEAYEEAGMDRQSYEEYKEAREDEGELPPELQDDDQETPQDTTESVDTGTSLSPGPADDCQAARWYVPDSDALSGPLDGVNCMEAQCDETEVGMGIDGMESLMACTAQLAQPAFDDAQRCANVALCPTPGSCGDRCDMEVDPEGADLAQQNFQGACSSIRCAEDEQPVRGTVGCRCESTAGGAGGETPGCTSPVSLGLQVGCPDHLDGRSQTLLFGDAMEIHSAACDSGVTHWEVYNIGGIRNDVDTFRDAIQAPCQ